MTYEFISNHEGRYGVEEMCSVLEVSRSSYYKWKTRGRSARDLEDEALKVEIARVHRLSKGRYGHRFIHSELQGDGLDCSRHRVLRLMREMGIAGDQSPSYKPQGTDSDHDYGYSPNLLKVRDGETGEWTRIKPSSIDEIWVADTTYLKIEGGWMYLAAVKDLFSRRIVGWSVSRNNDAQLVCQALRAAALTRGTPRRGIVHHSDRGSTYACGKYMKLLDSLGMLSSMSAKGNCYDNAAMESFFGRFKVSSVGNRVFESEDEVRATVFEYVEPYYNRFRRHSSLGYLSPTQFERKFCPLGGNGKHERFTNN